MRESLTALFQGKNIIHGRIKNWTLNSLTIQGMHHLQLLHG